MITYLDVYNVLNTQDWKTAEEIRADLSRQILPQCMAIDDLSATGPEPEIIGTANVSLDEVMGNIEILTTQDMIEYRQQPKEKPIKVLEYRRKEAA